MYGRSSNDRLHVHIHAAENASAASSVSLHSITLPPPRRQLNHRLYILWIKVAEYQDDKGCGASANNLIPTQINSFHKVSHGT